VTIGLSRLPFVDTKCRLFRSLPRYFLKISRDARPNLQQRSGDDICPPLCDDRLDRLRLLPLEVLLRCCIRAFPRLSRPATTAAYGPDKGSGLPLPPLTFVPSIPFRFLKPSRFRRRLGITTIQSAWRFRFVHPVPPPPRIDLTVARPIRPDLLQTSSAAPDLGEGFRNLRCLPLCRRHRISSLSRFPSTDDHDGNHVIHLVTRHIASGRDIASVEH